MCAAAFFLSCGHGMSLFDFGVSAFLFSLALDLTCCLDWNLICFVFMIIPVLDMYTTSTAFPGLWAQISNLRASDLAPRTGL